MHSDHYLDWYGLKFTGKIVLVGILAATAGHFAILYADAHSAPASPSLVLIQEAKVSANGIPGLALSTTTSKRVINALSIADAVPPAGKFIAIDLKNMVLTLYRDGTAVTKYPILATGMIGSPRETPPGFYDVLSKEPDSVHEPDGVHLPWSVQFYGNYFIHGWPYTGNAVPTNSSYTGGDIRLTTDDAERVYYFADRGTGVFVYNPLSSKSPPVLPLDTIPAPPVSAASYLIADIDTGDVYLEQNAGDARPIASVTKLMTALVANESTPEDERVAVARGELSFAQRKSPTVKETFSSGDLLYPLLVRSNNAVADALAQNYGTTSFIDRMNAAAKSLGMESTHFVDVSGISTKNVSTADDLFRLTVYLAQRKSFILSLTRTPVQNLISGSGNEYPISNVDMPTSSPEFVGGKSGKTIAAAGAMVSAYAMPINGEERHIAVIVLKSADYSADTEMLVGWFTESAHQGASLSDTACETCASAQGYRKILP